jgi:hypothetical protein
MSASPSNEGKHPVPSPNMGFVGVQPGCVCVLKAGGQIWNRKMMLILHRNPEHTEFVAEAELYE